MTLSLLRNYALLFFLILNGCGKKEASEHLGDKGQQHPGLILTQDGVEKIRASLGTVPLFDKTLEEVQKEVDEEIELGVVVPEPKDYSGGYSHERHKRNFLILQKAGLLFQILQDEKYAQYIKDVLFAYAEMYPELPLHPQTRSYARGKIFWQCLNDSNWLVYVSQAYDCIYEWLSDDDVEYLNTTLFRPFADFLSVGNPQFFDRVHNHSTWGNVAVGMIGLVMNDQELIERALYGSGSEDFDPSQKDNDGGLIRIPGQKAGFLANLDEPFSPDGYYTEGPYYQRYAMYPFMIFAEALQNKRPEFKVFEYKDGVLLKAVYALLNLTDSDGEFYAINDAQKGMSYYSRELVSAVDIAYHFGGRDPQLLSIAELQNKVLLDDTGLSVARDLAKGLAEPFEKQSVILTDGSQGDEGGLAVLRSSKEDIEINMLFKFAAQGLSHGHYDKLSYSLYTDGEEVVQDYGLARFVNIEQKGGGNYLKENKTWAKQTIAHNTLVQDRVSHFGGDFETGNKHHSELYFADLSNDDAQMVSAVERNAYPGTTMHRTMALINNEELELPFVLDVFHYESDSEHDFELPFYYLGQLISTNLEKKSDTNLKVLGSSDGYQHLWKESLGRTAQKQAQLTWLNKGRFYSLTSATQNGDEFILGRIGANDPDFNLRRDPVWIQRRENSSTGVFVSVIEAHGHYDPVSEIASNAYSRVEGIEVIYSDSDYVAIDIHFKSGEHQKVMLSLKDSSSDKEHSLEIKGQTYTWTGPYIIN